MKRALASIFPLLILVTGGAFGPGDVSWGGATSAAGAPATPAAVVIRAGSLVDGVSSAARPNQVIVIRGRRIESVADAAAARVPEGARVIDLSHATVLPGLIDSHTHIFLQGEDPAQGGYDANILKQPLSFRA